jgi:uncharacterized protein YdaU (DUF1376 family)
MLLIKTLGDDMNFYPHHIGDFNNATRHLTRVERSVYRDAIELYYDTECVLTLDINKLEKRLLCISSEEKDALKAILSEFFVETDYGYLNDRCYKEIEKYRANTSAKARAGIASAEARKNKSLEINTRSTRVEHNDTVCATNHEPLTNNHEPITMNHEQSMDVITYKENCNIVSAKNAPKKIASKLPDDWVLPKTYGDWALQERPLMTIQMVKLEADKFKDYWISLAGVKAKKLDWFATWRNWIRNAKIENTGNPHELKQKQREEYNKNTNARLVEKILGKEKEVNHAK